MKVKMIKFNLPLGEKSCRTKEDITENFNLLELLEYCKSGRFTLWCKVRKFEDMVTKLDNLKNENDEIIGEKLCDIFGVEKRSVRQEKILQAEEVARKQAEEVARKQAEEVARKQAEEVARKRAEEVARKRADDRLNITLNKVKCIKIGSFDGSFLIRDDIIPLFINFNTNKSKGKVDLIFRSGDNHKSIDIRASHIDIQNGDIREQIEVVKYQPFHGIFIHYRKGYTEPKRSYKTYYLYVYDIYNKLDDYKKEIFVEEAKINIFKHLNPQRILKGIKDA